LGALDGAAIEAALGELPGWRRDGDSLVREYRFGSFREAVSFIVRIAFAAEAANHHPELWNVYSTVRLRLNTHDAGNKVTARDLNLAREIESIAWVR
jgi:4a-hydroxytetrahydrobiopterin dehydratase